MSGDPKPDVCVDCHCRIFGGITQDGEPIKLEAVTKVYKWNPKTQQATEVKAGVAGTKVLADHLPRCTEMQRMQRRVKDLMDLTGGVVEDESVIPDDPPPTDDPRELDTGAPGSHGPYDHETPSTDDLFSGWED